MEKLQDINNDEVEINFKELFFLFKKRIVIILATALFFGGIAFGYTKFLVTPQYTSNAMMLVLTKETTLSSLADLQLGTQLTKDYRVLINSRPVLEEVIRNLDMDMDYKQFKNMITVTNPEDTRILQLSVTHSDPETAKRLVDELVYISSNYIGDRMEIIPPKIIEEGEVATTKTSPNVKKNTLIGFLIGILISCVTFTLIMLMDDTIKSEDDITKYLGLYTLSIVPDRKDYIGVKRNAKNNKKRRGGR